MIITRQLIAASRNIAWSDSFHGVDPSRIGLVQDVRSRANEILDMREGSTLEPFQVAYLQDLRSRLQDFCLVTFGAATEWLDAFSDAYNR